MSSKGKYLRGEKWFHLNRDADGNLTETIKKDLDKMKDINFYLEEKEKEKPVEKEVETKTKGKK